jgi:hypothetical protein
MMGAGFFAVSLGNNRAPLLLHFPQSPNPAALTPYTATPANSPLGIFAPGIQCSMSRTIS